MLLLAIACTSPKQEDSAEATDPPEVDLEQAFSVHERPFDLALHPDGRLYCSGQAGGKIYAWTPGSETPEELNHSFGDVQSIAFVGEQLYLTTSEFGVTGSIAVLGESGVETIATQSEDGTLLRWPADMVSDGEGGLWIADFEAGALFHLGQEGSLGLHSSGSSSPEALAWWEGTLYIGGEDGIWSKEGTGLPQQLSTAPAIGLATVDGNLWAVHPATGLFQPGQPPTPVSEIARPGSIVWMENAFYIADRVGQWVWKALVENE
jgi:hypothetical protein